MSLTHLECYVCIPLNMNPLPQRCLKYEAPIPVIELGLENQRIQFCTKHEVKMVFIWKPKSHDHNMAAILSCRSKRVFHSTEIMKSAPAAVHNETLEGGLCCNTIF